MQLHRDRERFTGQALHLVGMGTPAHGRAFKEETEVELPLLFSRDKAAYRAMDLRRGSLRQVLGARAALAGLRHRDGFTAKAPEQDWHQLGGAFVFDTSGTVVWEHRARHSGDNPDHERLAAALRDAA